MTKYSVKTNIHGVAGHDVLRAGTVAELDSDDPQVQELVKCGALTSLAERNLDVEMAEFVDAALRTVRFARGLATFEALSEEVINAVKGTIVSKILPEFRRRAQLRNMELAGALVQN